MPKRVFLIVLDSMGIGEMPDAHLFGDEGSNTLGSIRKHSAFSCPTLEKLGLFNIQNVGGGVTAPQASFARMREASRGKDTTVGHWEIAGVVSDRALPTYPDGFPAELIEEYTRLTGRGVLCNRPYSGTEVIKDFGREHVETGNLIVYTSADSVFQVAAHEAVVPVTELYRYCELAREMLCGDHAVGRVIARPFGGEYPYTRLPMRHDYSLQPPKKTMLDHLMAAGFDTISVGKISDIFAAQGVSESHPTKSNADGMRETSAIAQRDFKGICFTNLVDFDMAYGHRTDVEGYARAMSEFDAWLAGFAKNMRDEDVCVITADHGCDPATPSTDHSRECTPMLIFGKEIQNGVDLGVRYSFADIAATILECFGVKADVAGKSFYKDVCKEK